MVEAMDSKFRIISTTFNQSGVSITGKAHVTFKDFQDTWSGATFANFNTAMAGLSFNEFSVVPLSRSA
jgi:hypothetical protein